jgi:quercetin dioxygenase-like cupin family protein
MSIKDFVIPPGQGSVWHMAPGRSAALKITSDIAKSVMMFEEVAPTDTVIDLHVHHDSDEVAYVLSGEVTFMIGDQVSVGGAGTCAFLYHEAYRTLGRVPEANRVAYCSSTPPAKQAGPSKRPFV